MRLRIVAACLGVMASPVTVAQCIVESCYALTFDTRACVYETNKAANFRGVKLGVRAAAISAVPCVPGQTVTDGGVPGIVGITEYRYASQFADACRAFEGQRVTLFLDRKCCDMLPATGQCMLKEEVLRDLPPWAQGKRKAWEAPSRK